MNLLCLHVPTCPRDGEETALVLVTQTHMRILVASVVSALGLLAGLAGCNGGGATFSPRPENGTAFSGTVTSRADGDASGKSLMYVTNWRSGDVSILTYPQGVVFGGITGFDQPEGECVDAAGDVFIADQLHQEIKMFAHGGTTPIRTLTYRNAHPFGCSVDPVTGNLAVTNHRTSKAQPTIIAVYAGAQGVPKTYSFAGFQPRYCGYDNRGNLYIDGSVHHSEIAELPKGASAIVSVTLDKAIVNQGAVQWDGQYMVVAEMSPPIAYRVAFGRRAGKIVGTTKLSGAQDVGQFWIGGGKIVGPNANVYVWDYPSGGNPIRKFEGFTDPSAVVVTP